MFGKGKGKSAEKENSFRLRDSAPSIDDSGADDCSSQFVEDVLEPASAGPIYIKNTDGETYIPSSTYPSLPRLGDAGESSATRRAPGLDEMGDAREGSSQDAGGPNIRLYDTGDSGGCSSKGEGATNTNSAEIGTGSLSVDEMVRRNFFAASADGEVVEDKAESENELSDYLERLDWNSDTSHGERQSPTPQSTAPVVGLDPEEGGYEDEGVFDTPLARVPSNISQSSSCIGLGSSSMVYPENKSIRGSREGSPGGSPGGSPRRGNTYNPTILRGPQPVQPISLERGWTPPPLREMPPGPLHLANYLDSGGPLIKDPASYDGISADSNEPQSRGSGRQRGQASGILTTGLQTVVEEDEDEHTEHAVTRSSSPLCPTREDSSKNLNSPSGSDPLPSYTTSANLSFSLTSGLPIEDIQSSEQNTLILSPIYLAPIHLAPITLAPISLRQTVELDLDISPEATYLPRGQRVFTWDQASRASSTDHEDLLQAPRVQVRSMAPPSRGEEPARFQKPPATMMESMNRFRDFVASTTPIANRDAPVLLDGSWDEESEDEDGNVGALERRRPAYLGRTSRPIPQPIVSSISPYHIPRVMSMEERWGIEEPSPNSGFGRRSGSRQVPRTDDNMRGPDRWNRRTNKDENRKIRPSLSRAYPPPLPPPPDFELRTPSPDIGVNIFSPQGNPHWRVPRSKRAPPARKSFPLASNPDLRGYFKSALEAIEHHSWQLTQSDANWSEVGDWNCQSCGWLSPKTSTECYHCHSTVTFKAPRAGPSSVPHRNSPPEETGRGPLDQTSLVLEESEPSHSTSRSEDDELRGRSQKKNNNR